MNKLRLGVDTYDSTVSSFGDKIYKEYKFGNIPLPRIINGNYYPVDRIIRYFGTLSTKSESDDGRTSIRRIATKERQTIALFFYRNTLIDYSVYQMFHLDPNSSAVTLGENATEDVKKKFQETNGGMDATWPEAYCDDKYYYYKHNRASEFVETYLKEDCIWETDGFDEELRKSGFYERKKKMDKGDFSKLVRERP